MNFLQTSYELLTNFLQTSYKLYLLLVNCKQTSCEHTIFRDRWTIIVGCTLNTDDCSSRLTDQSADSMTSAQTNRQTGGPLTD